MKGHISKNGKISSIQQDSQGGYMLGQRVRQEVKQKVIDFGDWLNAHQMDRGVVFRNIGLLLLIAGGLSYFIYILLQALL